jgi:hypothetical protein
MPAGRGPFCAAGARGPSRCREDTIEIVGPADRTACVLVADLILLTRTFGAPAQNQGCLEFWRLVELRLHFCASKFSGAGRDLAPIRSARPRYVLFSLSHDQTHDRRGDNGKAPLATGVP